MEGSSHEWGLLEPCSRSGWWAVNLSTAVIGCIPATRPAIFAMLFGAVKIPPQNGLAANRIHN